MKNLFPFLVGFVLGCIIFTIGYAYAIHVVNRQDLEYGVVYPVKCMPMPEEFRKATGYDSVQYYKGIDGKVKVNFCCPNKFEFYKFKTFDTIYIHDTIRVKPKNKKGGYITDAKPYWPNSDVWDNNHWQPDPPIVIDGIGSHNTAIGYKHLTDTGSFSNQIGSIAVGNDALGTHYWNGYKWIKLETANTPIITLDTAALEKDGWIRQKKDSIRKVVIGGVSPTTGLPFSKEITTELNPAIHGENIAIGYEHLRDTTYGSYSIPLGSLYRPYIDSVLDVGALGARYWNGKEWVKVEMSNAPIKPRKDTSNRSNQNPHETNRIHPPR